MSDHRALFWLATAGATVSGLVFVLHGAADGRATFCMAWSAYVVAGAVYVRGEK